jgi:hypothetical protein
VARICDCVFVHDLPPAAVPPHSSDVLMAFHWQRLLTPFDSFAARAGQRLAAPLLFLNLFSATLFPRGGITYCPSCSACTAYAEIWYCLKYIWCTDLYNSIPRYLPLYCGASNSVMHSSLLYHVSFCSQLPAALHSVPSIPKQ